MKITIKNIMNEFKVDRSTAYKVVRLANGTIDLELFDSVKARIRECYHRPHDIDLTLTAINALIKGYGVDSVPYYNNALYTDDFINFVNMGDTYKTTICFNPDLNKYVISDWRSIYEMSPECASQNEQDEEVA